MFTGSCDSSRHFQRLALLISYVNEYVVALEF